MRGPQKRDRATRRILFDAEEAEVLEEAVAIEHRRVDRRKRRAAGEECAGQKQADERVPPRGVVEIDHERTGRLVRRQSAFQNAEGVEIPSDVSVGVGGEEVHQAR